MVKYLDQGAKGNGNFIKNGTTLNTVLIKAIKVSDMDIFRTFVDGGASVNYIDEGNKFKRKLLKLLKK